LVAAMALPMDMITLVAVMVLILSLGMWESIEAGAMQSRDQGFRRLPSHRLRQHASH
jgi:predicted membrane protein